MTVLVGLHRPTVVVVDVRHPSVAVKMMVKTKVLVSWNIFAHRGYKIHFLRVGAPPIRRTISTPYFLFDFSLTLTPHCPFVVRHLTVTLRTFRLASMFPSSDSFPSSYVLGALFNYQSAARICWRTFAFALNYFS